MAQKWNGATDTLARRLGRERSGERRSEEKEEGKGCRHTERKHGGGKEWGEGREKSRVEGGGENGGRGGATNREREDDTRQRWFYDANSI